MHIEFEYASPPMCWRTKHRNYITLYAFCKCFKNSSFSGKIKQNLLTTFTLLNAKEIMKNKEVYNVAKMQYLLLSQSQTFFSPLVSQFSSEAWSLCNVETAYDANSWIPIRTLLIKPNWHKQLTFLFFPTIIQLTDLTADSNKLQKNTWFLLMFLQWRTIFTKLKGLLSK